ncbi:MAG: PAS domain-containing protein, partial [Desulfobacteraceae bacterium]
NENFQNYIHSDDLERVFNSLKAVFDNRIHPSEYRVMTKDGTWRWVRTSTRPIVKNNTITSLHGVLVDIHQRKKAEENQKALQAKLSSAMEIAGLGHWEYDVINDLFFFNDQFYKIFRTTAEDAGGYTMSSAEYADRFVHPEDSHMVKREIEKALSTGDPGYSSQTEHRIRYADGETGYISVHFFIVKNSQGETIRTYGVNQDITQRRQAQKLEAIGSLAGGIAHDFNNLLFPIIGLSELFMEDFSPDTLEYQNALEIFKAGQRGASLVKQILSFSRQSDHRLMPTRVHTILDEAVKLCRSTIPANIEIVREIKKNSSTVMADPTQLHQIAMNLITNAFHALEETGGTILVQLEDVFIEPDHSFGLTLDPGKYSRMKISDNGPGIAPTVIEKIFDPYFTTKEKSKGTGLGLATVYGIVKEHGGDIKVESQPGRGTCFSVYFPLIETAASVEVDRETNRVFPGTESILLVDDEKPVVQLEKLILERLGYQVTACIGSVEALEIFSRNKNVYDIVVTDMNMPGMTGDELAKEILLLRPDIPIIICTGFSERINKQKAESLGIKGILMKPVVKTEMAKMIKTLLDESKGASF